MLTGKAYARAFRGLLMIKGTLYTLIYNMIKSTKLYQVESVNETKESDGVMADLKMYINQLMSNETTVTEVIETDSFKHLKTNILKFKNSLSESPSALLWFQLLDMIEILCNSLVAERIGNWILHLKSMNDMLPYFAASGLYLYAKST